jgi:nicotinamide phosphoribosyltransferase
MRGDWNPLSFTDSYKMSHFRQYPPGSQRVYSYFESRGSDPKLGFKDVVFFGLQYWLEMISGRFVTANRIDKVERRCRQHFDNNSNFNRQGWEHILNVHDGRLPVRIKAVPEGAVVPTHNCLMTIENTDPACYWLTNWLETMLVQVWYPTTVATQSREMKKMLLKFLEETGDPAGIDFKLHDFGCRGVSSIETAGIGGGAHLVNFKGSDTMPALEFLDETYGEECGGFSIPASEHSTITSWGEDHEVDAMRNMLEQYPDGLVACVSDSFDIYRACSEYWGGALRNAIISRRGALVIRPDSGDPATVACQALESLGKKFPVTTNRKGFKILDPHVRLIQGDGIDFTSLGVILAAIKKQGWSADNIAFGSGGGLLQKLNRDTLKFAFKCSSILIGDEEREVFKRPITDHGKMSKAGRFKLIRRDGPHGPTYATIKEGDPGEDILRVVFEDGRLLNRTTFSEVRQRAAITTISV